ncbi:MAG: hypothetical protein QM328_12665 [Acidobacteriota bacterium]|nr:hypothetical protein [Acidobacteriota bacterium]
MELDVGVLVMMQQLLMPRSALPTVLAQAPGGVLILDRLGMHLDGEICDLATQVSIPEAELESVGRFLAEFKGVLSTARRCAQISSGTAGLVAFIFPGSFQTAGVLLGPEALHLALLDRGESMRIFESLFEAKPGSSVRALFLRDGEPVDARIYRGRSVPA